MDSLAACQMVAGLQNLLVFTRPAFCLIRDMHVIMQRGSGSGRGAAGNQRPDVDMAEYGVSDKFTGVKRNRIRTWTATAPGAQGIHCDSGWEPVARFIHCLPFT